VKIREKPEGVPTRNALAFGPPKSGKTLMAALTAPGPVLYLNADLPNATWLAHQAAPEGHLIEPEFEDARKSPVFELMQEIETLANEGKLAGKVRTVVVDPINELYLRLLRELSGNAISPSLPTYQAVQTFVERLARALCICPDVNAIFVAHDLPVKDEGTGRVERLPATGTTNPALGRKLMGMVDVNAYLKGVDTEDGGRAYVAAVADRFHVLERNHAEPPQAPGQLSFSALSFTRWFDLMANAPVTTVMNSDGATPDDDTGATPEEE
jgi:hypothetical protein